jgi:hypothetical protein
MSDRDRIFTGLIVRPISGGYEEKGGVNHSNSKVVSRPPAPASMAPRNQTSPSTTERRPK